MKFKRKVNTRPISKLFIILPEGTTTEYDYFEQIRRIFGDKGTRIPNIHPIPHKKSQNNPDGLIKKMQAVVSEKSYDRNYEAWLVFDRDQRTYPQFDMVKKWAKKDYRHHFALSNPKFEYWLLLHFEDVSGNITSEESTRRLKKYLPDYDKGIPRGAITIDNVRQAYETARVKHRLCSDLWNNNGSNVYQLIESIAKEAGVDLSPK